MREAARIIVPHRGLSAAKTRLAPVLEPDERVALARTLLEHVLHAAGAAADDVVVISPAASLAPVVAACGARLVVQRGLGLNEGLDQARAEGLRDGVGLLVVLHGDLPKLAADDVRALISAIARPSGVAIAPDRAGRGTNGLGLRPPDAIAFRFGEGSLAAHRLAAGEAGVPVKVVNRPGLAFDLDTPEDLARWLAPVDVA